MPLPPSIRLRAVVEVIDPAKDIDGIHPLNAGLLRLGYDGFLPATAHAAVEILRRSGIEIEGRRATVIGRSAVVGMPAAFLLVRENATVTVCHTPDPRSPSPRQGRGDRRRRGRPPWPRDRADAPSGRGRRRRRHQRRRWHDRRRRRLRIGQQGCLGHHARSRAASGPLTNALLLAHLVRAAQAQASQLSAGDLTSRDESSGRAGEPRPTASRGVR